MNGQSSVSNPLNACISCMRAAGVKPFRVRATYISRPTALDTFYETYGASGYHQLMRVTKRPARGTVASLRSKRPRYGLKKPVAATQMDEVRLHEGDS